MTDYDERLPVRPRRIQHLALDGAGRPVPWFVKWIDGKPDFRVMDADKFRAAIKLRLCWTCGEPLGAISAFVIGPMCAVNGTSAEPPSHTDCGVYAATACPFLTNPKKIRREGNLPEGHRPSGGVMLPRNPGVALVWVTRKYRAFRVDNGVLFEIGDPTETHWFAEGRQATRAEVLESIESGLPLLRAAAEPDGQRALDHLDRQTATAMTLIPA